MSSATGSVKYKSAELRDEWLEAHAEELAAGRLPSFKTAGGRTVRPAYGPADLEELDFDYEAQLGMPGEPPYTRGATAGGYRKQLWSWEFYAGFGSAEDANKRYRYLLETGATGGVSIALDLPTQIGMDSDHPLAAREIGKVGVALDTLDDVRRMFDGIDLKQAGKIFTTGNSIGPIACAWFYCLAEERGEDPHDVIVTIQNDPLKEYVARGTQFLPVPASVRCSGDVIEFCAERNLPWYPISVSGSHMQQSGGTCVQEAAFTIANGTAYADEVAGRGLNTFAPLMELHFCTDMEFFEEIAKYRVVRRIWTEILSERYGIEGQPPRLHAVTSGLPLTAQQPRNNIIRITLQALAQILGGVPQTRTASYDEALAIPAEDAVKLSIRTNQIIAHETGIPNTVDPLGGSYYLETLTQEMYEEVKAILAQVEDMGGAIVAVESGWFREQLAEGAYEQEKRLESGERKVVGVNVDVEDDDHELKLFKLDAEAAERQKKRLAQHKADRDEGPWRQSMDQLTATLESGSNSVPPIIEAVKAGATIGEICDRLRAAYGEYRPEVEHIG
jgi:methylmalonyl-CoA mutase N-terminal domain/subunit